MGKEVFELEDYKPVFRQGAPHHEVKGIIRTSRTGFWYKFITVFPQHKLFIKKPSTITNIVRTFNENMIIACVENRSGVEFPERLGILIIGSYKAGENLVDHATSAKLLKRVRHRNLHSGGYAACINYNVYDNCNYTHRDLWDFNACFNFRQKVSQAFRKNWAFYTRLEKFWEIAHMRKKSFIKDFMIKKETELLKDYNEFYIAQ